MLTRILVTEGLRRERAGLTRRLERHALVFRAPGRGGPWSTLREEPIDVLLALPADLGPDPHATLRELAAAPRPPQVVLGVGDDAGTWAGSGATLLPGDLDVEAQLEVLRGVEDRVRALRQRSAARPGRLPGPTLDAFGRTSRTIRCFRSEVRRAAASDAPILIHGEPGTGKGWLGPVLHRESPRARGPFHTICFAALARESVESELFGHGPGSAPGTTRAGRGLLEQAHGGTLFLEHADRAPAEVQRSLAAFLDRRSIRPAGVAREVRVDVRLVASVHRPTTGDAPPAGPEIEPDLRRRFALADLEVPPLRTRTEDLPELAEGVLASCRGRFGSSAEGFSDAAMEALLGHTWPGNLKELWSVVERAALLARGPVIRLEDLPAEVRSGQGSPEQALHIDAPWLGNDSSLEPLREVRSAALAVVDRAYLDRLLRATGGRLGEAARLAAIDPRSLYGLMRRHGLRKEDYKRQGPTRSARRGTGA